MVPEKAHAPRQECLGYSASLLLLFTSILSAQQGLVSLPAHTVEMTDPHGIVVPVRVSPFAVSPREVTQREYEAVTGSNPSANKGPDNPVENVTWWDAIRYCNLRSLREKLEPVYDLATGRVHRTRNGYRLLTDAEWTYAAGKPPKPEAAVLGPAQTKNAADLLRYAREHRTHPAGSKPANEHGLHDMYGNVWEWVQDHQDPSGEVLFASNPAGPERGVARLLRGGSYISTTSNWGRGYRTSLEPDRRSPFTGFRIARSLPDTGDHPTPPEWLKTFQDIPAAMHNQTGGLSPLAERRQLRDKWSRILGSLPALSTPPEARLAATHHMPGYTGEMRYLRVEPDYEEKLYVMLPPGDVTRPLPVVIVPFYDVDTPAGTPMGGRRALPAGTRAFGAMAVRQGMAAVAIRWFGESYGEGMAEAVASLQLRHPGITGMGKWVHDARRLLDYMETRREFDMRRVGIIGHSLGGKMALYAAAMDGRIRAVVSSEPGIGLSFSNYEDFWYLGEKAATLPPGTDHHELLALIAPRPFLLIGGDSADNDKSWHYINAVRPLYKAAPDAIGYFNHRKGHSPTPESVRHATDWLVHWLRR